MAAPKKTAQRSRVVRKSSRRRQQPTRDQQAQASHTGAAQAIPVVGVGASAGGLAAFRELFTAMPSDTGMAFVLIQHLSPDYESLMAELMGRYTEMPVIEVENRMRVEANHVYLIPPNKYLSISDGELCLTAPVERRGMRMAIDFFFSSLAEDQNARAIGIVLSGTGTDGTIGLKAIKSAGGMVIAQQPETAQYDGMPRSAIATGVVDYMLSLEQMPDVLIKYVRHSYVNGGSKAAVEDGLTHLHRILAVVHTRTGYDFSYYKHNTLIRRIKRRMGIRHVEAIEDYVRCLREDPIEITALIGDLLISVTGFFREREAWQCIQETVLPPLVNTLSSQETIRVWTPACATGEEPYTIAMLLLDHLRRVNKRLRVQVFATDIDANALEIARAGFYSESVAADVPTEYLDRFFIHDMNGYRVNKDLRDTVVFSAQNLISDPPFSKLDLISCRNLLIYLQPEAQEKVMALFHFALKPERYLILGKSESIGPRQDLFEVLSKEFRIYRRLETAYRANIEIPLGNTGGRRRARERVIRQHVAMRSIDLTLVTQQQLLREFAPATVLINRTYEILNMHGPVRQYLDFPEGEPTYELTKMLLPGLRTRLRSAVHKAISENVPVTIRARIVQASDRQYVTCFVRPVTDPPEASGLLLVTFQDEALATTDDANVAGISSDEILTVRQLEHELEAVREDLQNSLEEMETSNEELKASNEEIMSMNEELQSANEELETSKEELQSLNEELSTVNTQLQEKVRELEQTRDDMGNFLASTNIAMVFLDTDCCIKRFTPAAQDVLHLIPTDVGRPIEDIAQRFQTADGGPVQLQADAETVLDTLTALERELLTDRGRWYIQRVQPYRTERHQIEGIVLAFTDVTSLKQAQETARASEAQLQLIANHLPALIGYVGPDERYRFVNAPYSMAVGKPIETIVGTHVQELLGQEAYQRAKPYLDEALAGRRAVFEQPTPSVYSRRGWELIHLVPNLMEQGQADGFFVLISDLTDRKLAEELLRASEERLRAIFDSVPQGIAVVDRDRRYVHVNDRWAELLGYPVDELLQMTFVDITHLDDVALSLRFYEELATSQSARRTIRQRFRRKNGSVFQSLLTARPVRSMSGNIEAVVAVITDIEELEEVRDNVK